MSYNAQRRHDEHLDVTSEVSKREIIKDQVNTRFTTVTF